MGNINEGENSCKKISNLKEAKDILATMFEIAKSNIKIFCSDKVVRLIMETFIDFFGKCHIPVTILVDNYSRKTSNYLSMVGIPEYVQIKPISEDKKKKLKSEISSQNEFYFVVVDKRAYLFEYDTERHLSIGSFCDKQQSKIFAGVFDKIFKLELSDVS